jgi:hypothetical protein
MSIWLFKRFIPDHRNDLLEFVPLGHKLPNSKALNRAEIIYVDTTGGKYDHHASNRDTCSAKLVMREHSLDNDLAIKRMTDFALSVDQGRIYNIVIDDFSILNVIDGLNFLYPDNPKLVLNRIVIYLDAIYKTLTEQIAAEKILKRAIKFKTRWGKGAALVSSNPIARRLAHRKGFKVFVFLDPVNGFGGITSPGNSNVDLNLVYRRIKKADPSAEWFLHSSKKLLLSGSLKAPQKKGSKLSLEQMINILKA